MKSTGDLNSRISHRMNQQLLPAFIAGEIHDPETLEKLHTHIQTCSECQEELQTIRMLRHLLGSLDHEPVLMPAKSSLADAVLAQAGNIDFSQEKEEYSEEKATSLEELVTPVKKSTPGGFSATPRLSLLKQVKRTPVRTAGIFVAAALLLFLIGGSFFWLQGINNTAGMQGTPGVHTPSNDPTFMQYRNQAASEFALLEKIENSVKNKAQVSIGGSSYALDYPYTANQPMVSSKQQSGVGAILRLRWLIEHAGTVDEIKQAYTLTYQLRQCYEAFEDNLTYKEPANTEHRTDLDLINLFHTSASEKHLPSQIIVISLSEQVLRLYDQNKLQLSVPITTGRASHPLQPGIWLLNQKHANLNLSRDQLIQETAESIPSVVAPFALQLSSGQYLHDAPGRTQFGAGSQFPTNPTPTLLQSGDFWGANLSPTHMQHLFNQVIPNTLVIIY